jgi:hypothetical protein
MADVSAGRSSSPARARRNKKEQGTPQDEAARTCSEELSNGNKKEKKENAHESEHPRELDREHEHEHEASKEKDTEVVKLEQARAPAVGSQGFDVIDTLGQTDYTMVCLVRDIASRRKVVLKSVDSSLDDLQGLLCGGVEVVAWKRIPSATRL